MTTEACQVAQANFALALLKEAAEGGKNAFLSPVSISLALAMTYTGADGDTAKQMKAVMAPGMSDADFHKAHEKLMKMIGEPSDKHELHTANRIYAHDQMTLLPGAKDKLKTHYQAELSLVNFQGDGTKIAGDINAWVEQITKDKIKNLISPSLLNAYTRMILVNAIYFKGFWLSQFDECRTAPQDFHISKSKKKEVEMMHKKDKYFYAEDDSCQVLGMPYKSADLCMYVILPKEQCGLDNLEKSLTGSKLVALMNEAELKDVIVSMPKFKLEQSFMLKDALTKMGMKDMFDEHKANFHQFAEPGKGVEDNLYVSAVVHKAFLEVDETGSEAAAATGVMMATRMCLKLDEAPVPEFTADHPFLIALAHSRLPLFIGRYAAQE